MSDTPLLPPPPLASAPAPVEPRHDAVAEVRVGQRVTRYHRLGAGAPAIVLAPRAFSAASRDAAIWPGVVESLAAYRRVLLPELPPVETELRGSPPGFITWLRGFADGLGLAAPLVLATGPLCIPAIEFALLDADRVAGLVLVPSGGAEETGLAGELAATGGSGALPVLVLRRECGEERAIALVQRFVGGRHA